MNVKALVIDDNKDVREVIVELLQFCNVEVIGTGSNGKGAAELYRSLRPDIVFMDVLMPEYDGFYGLEKIRECDPTALVVFMTASDGVEERLASCKDSHILTKPIDLNKLQILIERFCIKQCQQVS